MVGRAAATNTNETPARIRMNVLLRLSEKYTHFSLKNKRALINQKFKNYGLVEILERASTKVLFQLSSFIR